MIAYFDFAHDGGYTALAATAVPDAQGRYTIEISDLAPCRYGDLRIEYCHVNGTVLERHDRFAVTKTGAVNLDVRTDQAPEPLGKAVMAQDLNTARASWNVFKEAMLRPSPKRPRGSWLPPCETSRSRPRPMHRLMRPACAREMPNRKLPPSVG